MTGQPTDPKPEQQQVFQPEKIMDLASETFFNVEVGTCQELEDLKERARKLREKSFQEKYDALLALTIDSLKNVYLSDSESDMDLLKSKHSLAEALKAGHGCCRYQSLLFFILSAEAGLGTYQALLTKRIHGNFFSVFNVIYDELGNKKEVSIFNESLPEDDTHRYEMDIFIPGYDTATSQEYPFYIVDSSGEVHFYKVPGAKKREVAKLYNKTIL